jgi:hypothetical protein
MRRESNIRTRSTKAQRARDAARAEARTEPANPDSLARGVSPQMQNLLRRYDVANERALNKAVREEYARETGERFSVAVADVLIDQMLEAEYQRIEGGAYDKEDK